MKLLFLILPVFVLAHFNDFKYCDIFDENCTYPVQENKCNPICVPEVVIPTEPNKPIEITLPPIVVTPVKVISIDCNCSKETEKTEYYKNGVVKSKTITRN